MNSRWRQRATPIRFNTGQIGQQTNERTNEQPVELTNTQPDQLGP